jgi:hypothetical protein
MLLKDQEMLTKRRGMLVFSWRFILFWAIPEFVPVILQDELKVRIAD